jgi:hypothetical protein
MLQNQATMSELYTADQSHNAGSTAATDANFLPSATFYGTNVRNLAQLPSRRAPTAALSSRGRPRGTGTWHTRSASNDGQHNITNKEFKIVFLAFAVHLRALHGVVLFLHHLQGVSGYKN